VFPFCHKAKEKHHYYNFQKELNKLWEIENGSQEREKYVYLTVTHSFADTPSQQR